VNIRCVSCLHVYLHILWVPTWISLYRIYLRILRVLTCTYNEEKYTSSNVYHLSHRISLEFVAYTDDVVEIMRQHRKHEHQLRHHIYADDMQLYAYSKLTGDHSTLQQLQNCITEIREWCAKTEVIWFGSRANLSKLANFDCSLTL
jgi:hypothetical protein